MKRQVYNIYNYKSFFHFFMHVDLKLLLTELKES